MSGLGELGIAALMLVGLVGVLLPLVPGTALVLGAGVLWAVLDGGGGARWTVVALMAALLVAGIALKYALPGKRLAGGLPRTTLLAGAVGAVAGFFVVPVVGLLVGGVAGVYVAEQARLREPAAAWRSTVEVLRAVGLGMLAELSAGVLMVAVWGAGVLAT